MGVPIALGYKEDAASGAQIIDGSLRFNRGSSHYLSRTPASPSNRTTWTWAGWIKRNLITSAEQNIFVGSDNPTKNNTTNSSFYFSVNGGLLFGGWNSNYISTNAFFRDPSAWYHIVLAVDTNQATDTNRIKVYVNNVLQTYSQGGGFPGQSTDIGINQTYAHYIGGNDPASGYASHMYANVYFIDGQQLDPSYFGYTDPLTNTWRPKKYVNTTSTAVPITTAPSLSNGALIIKATDASIAGTIVSGGGNLNFLDSSDGISWTHRSTGTSYTFSGAKYLAAGGSGTSNRTFTPSPNELYEYLVWNTNTNFDTGSNTTTDVTGSTFIASPSSIYGTNGFYLPLDGSAPMGQDQSGRGNNWTPVNFGGSNTIEKATGALPILNTDGGGKVARVGVRTDANASSLVLALPLVGIKSDFSNAINSGTSNKAITVTNAVASSTQSMFYGGSFRFDGTGDYMTIPDNTDLNFGNGDFTIEGWAYSTNNATQAFGPTNYASAGTFDYIIYDNGGKLGFAWYPANSGSAFISSTNNWPLNTWFHWAVTRSGNTFRLFINGNIEATGTNSTALSHAANTIYIGRTDGLTARDFNGYQQDIRVYKGIAKYTSNFIPASTDPDIVPDSPSGVSYSSNVALVPSTDGAVAFDNNGDYLSLTSGSDFQFGSGDFTVECFVYPNSLSNYDPIIDNGSIAGNNQHDWRLYLGSVGEIWFDAKVGGTDATRNGASGGVSNGVVTGKWQHIAVVRTGNTILTFLDGVQVLSNSFSSTIDSNYTTAYIGYDVMVSGGNYYFDGFISNLHVVKGTALYTSNFTPPTGPISSVANTKLLCCKSNTSAGAADASPNISGINDGTVWSDYMSTSGTLQVANSFPLAFDGSTSTNVRMNTGNGTMTYSGPSFTVSSQLRMYLYQGNGGTGSVSINGVDQGVSFATEQWYTIGSFTGTVNTFTITASANEGTQLYAVEVDGVILKDPLTRNGNASATNFNPFTVNINTQRGKQSGYATLNPLAKGSSITLSNGNLTCTKSGAGYHSVLGNVGVSTGQWYWEVDSNVSGNNLVIGIARETFNQNNLSSYIDIDPVGYIYRATDGYKSNNNSVSSYGSSYSSGDVVGVALNLNAGTITFYKNGISQGVAFSGLSGTYFAGIGIANGYIATANFGQKPFKFPPPAGFQPLTLANTPRPTIVRPDQYVGISTWTGTGAARSITTRFKPDFVWIKERGDTGGHVLYDTVRGATKHLASHSTNAEATDTDALTSFNNYGFSLGSGYTVVSVNGSTRTYVGWAWKAGGNSNTFNINDVGYATASAAGLTAGTITPSGASVNTKSGFSIIKYNSGGSAGNYTISHGLTQTPKFIIHKSLGTSNWWVYHASVIDNLAKYMQLNSTNAIATNSANMWGGQFPDSSVLGVRVGDLIGTNTDAIMYSWAEIPGFSKFGSYTGTSSTNFINLGFKPTWVMIKNSSSSSYPTYTGWAIFDTERTPNNTNINAIFANSSQQEGLRGNGSGSINPADFSIDLLSNGFCLRDNGASEINLSGNSYIFAAFAEAPTFNLYGAQANAR